MNPARPTLDFLVDEAAAIYSLPLYFDRLNQAINHTRSTVADITKIISEDAGLSSSILKMANSPMFGYFTEIDSISKAVTIIGTRQLRDMALSVSVMGVFNDIPEEVLNMTTFWQHSITCGTVARILATYRREANVERYFVAGMLHDVGQLILCTRAPSLVREMIARSRESGIPHFAVQRSVLGFDHGTVGGELLKRWQIPASIAEPVTCHHTPEQAELFPIETAIIHVADIISLALQIGFDGETYIPHLHTACWERLNIPVSMLASIINLADTQVSEIMAIITGDACS